MFLKVASGSSDKPAKTQATAPITFIGDSSLLFLRPAGWLRGLVERIAAPAHDRTIERRLRTLRWCDSTERALLDDSTDLRGKS
jgi:hypothetical protein